MKARAMPVYTITEIRSHLAKGQRLLGLDLGERTIGLALSDPGCAVASTVS